MSSRKKASKKNGRSKSSVSSASKSASKSGISDKDDKSNKSNKGLLSNPKAARKALADMIMIRRFEERAGQLYGMGLIGGFCHLYIGQEAVIVGIHAALKKGDAVITSYRDHGALLACGGDPNATMAELTGRATGVSKGKGGSMHMFDPERGFYGGHGIVGAQVPIGTGIALKQKMTKDNGITVAMLGEGALNQGQVAEAFNIASLWKLPVLYLIENNGYAMGTSIKRSSSRSELFRAGEALGIEGSAVDGQEVLEVEKAVAKALDPIRAGKGPQIIEMRTYRYRGHSMSDPAQYRPKEEVDDMKNKHDPIHNYTKLLTDKGMLTDAQLKEIETDVKAKVAEAVEFAKVSPEPEAEELYTDVLA